MPHKRRTHGRHGEHGGALLDGHLPSRFAAFCPSAVSKYLKSHSGATPKPAAPVTTFEQQKTSAGSSMASKPSATGTETATGSAAKTNLSGPDMTLFSPKGWSKSGSAAAQVKTSTAPASVSKPAQPKDSAAKSTTTTAATTTVKVDPVKTVKPSTAMTTNTSSSTGTTTSTTTAASRTAAAKTSTAATKAAKPQVQVEVPKAPEPKQTGLPLDPMDALASFLPSKAAKSPEPKYSGPEVKEDVTSEEGIRVGEREDTLPPGYRLQDMAPVPADAKPAEVPKPMSTADALDVLSGDFMFETPQKPVETISAASTARSNFAPAPTPTKKAESAAPPADKKAKLDADLFSLSAAVPSAPVSAAAPVASAAKGSSAKSPSSQMSLDALSALEDLLPSAEPPKPQPALRPEDIVSEATVEEEEAVRVGEREDTLPPEYRLKPGEVSQLPAPKPQPSLDTTEALDILSGDFCDSSKAAAQKSPAPPADKKPRIESDGFSLEAGLTPSSAQKVESSVLPPPKKKSDTKTEMKTEKKAEKPAAAKETTGSGPAAGQMSLDALSALEDLLPSAEPPKPQPALRPEDIVSEAAVEEDEAVRVGEREDTLPPEYRLKPGEISQLPAPKPQPSLDTTEALDILAGDFCDSSAPSTKTAPSAQPTAPPAESLSALDCLSQDFVSPSKGAAVQALAPPPQKSSAVAPVSSTVPVSAVKKPEAKKSSSEKPKDSQPTQGGTMSLDALSALEDLLPSAAPPKPQPAVRPEDIVSEATVEEEEAVRVGEREDTLPPEYRLKPGEVSQLPAPKPQPSLDTTEALDILSGDFSSSCAPSTQSALDALSGDFVAASSAPSTQSAADAALDALSGDFVAPSAAPTVQSSACAPLAAGAHSALDALSDTLKDIAPTPQPEPAMPTNIVKEKQIEEERLIKMGERDDTLPPEYRPTEEELKKMQEEMKKAPKSPKEKPMDDKTALDLLAGDFECPAPAPAPAPASAPASSASAPVSSSASAPVSSSAPATDSDPQKPMSRKVLDSLSDTLLPDTFKKTEKPKAKSKSRSRTKKSPAEGATDLLSSQLSSDVLPSTKS